MIARFIVVAFAFALALIGCEPAQPADSLECNAPPVDGEECRFDCECAEGLFCRFDECQGVDCNGDVGVCGEEQA